MINKLIAATVFGSIVTLGATLGTISMIKGHEAQVAKQEKINVSLESEKDYQQELKKARETARGLFVRRASLAPFSNDVWVHQGHEAYKSCAVSQYDQYLDSDQEVVHPPKSTLKKIVDNCKQESKIVEEKSRKNLFAKRNECVDGYKSVYEGNKQLIKKQIHKWMADCNKLHLDMQ